MEGHILDKVTWSSVDNITENKIDHICISSKWRGNLLDVEVKRNPDIGYDQHLLVVIIRLKIGAVKFPNEQSVWKFDIFKVNNEEVRNSFIEELKSIPIDRDRNIITA